MNLWRLYFPVYNFLKLEGFAIISNPYQRTGRGRRLIINKSKFLIRNITNSLIDIPWGVEAIWAILTPKTLTNNSLIKKIIICGFYNPPNSNAKYKLLDHICGNFHLLSAKYGHGTHFIIAGDANEMKLDNIVQLSVSFRQVVTEYTRMSPPAILDPIITDLANFYQPSFRPKSRQCMCKK